MGQYWDVICPAAGCIKGSGCKLGEYFWDSTHGFEAHLWWPMEDIDSSPFQVHVRVQSREQPSSGLPRLTDFAPELICGIFEHLDYWDAVCLGITCRYLWNVGVHIILRNLRRESLFGNWIGHQIVCLGDNSTTLPPNLEGKMDLPVYTDDDEIFTASPEPSWLESGFSRLQDVIGWRYYDHFPHAVYALVNPYDVYGEKYELFFPSNKKWVLRNLTTHQFIRAEAISDEFTKGEGPRLRGAVTFGHVLLANICWSSEDQVHFRNDRTNISQGPWAGHRFAILPEDSVIPEMDPEVEWEDISEQMHELVMSIWESEFGLDLKEILKPPNRIYF